MLINCDNDGTKNKQNEEVKPNQNLHILEIKNRNTTEIFIENK